MSLEHKNVAKIVLMLREATLQMSNFPLVFSSVEYSCDDLPEQD
jgi:hypothetical protein